MLATRPTGSGGVRGAKFEPHLAEQHIQTNIYQRDEEMKIKRKDVETREAVLELERQQKDAEAKQQREIETVVAMNEIIVLYLLLLHHKCLLHHHYPYLLLMLLLLVLVVL